MRGGAKYGAEAKGKSEKHLFALESDGGGLTPRTFTFGGAAEQLGKVKSWIPLLYPYGVYNITPAAAGLILVLSIRNYKQQLPNLPRILNVTLIITMREMTFSKT